MKKWMIGLQAAHLAFAFTLSPTAFAEEQVHASLNPANPAQETAPTPKELPMANPRMVGQAGKEAAQIFAEEVIAVYGPIESVRQALVRGKREAETTIRNTDISSYNEYEEGRSSGASDGRSHGLRRGQSEGTSAGTSAGQREARTRFESAVQNGSAPDLKYRTLTQNTSGFESTPKVDSISSHISKNSENLYRDLEDNLANSRAHDEMRRQGVLRTLLDIDTIEDKPDTYVLSYMWKRSSVHSRSRTDLVDTAFQVWRDQSDRYLNERPNNRREIYRDFSDPSRYANADDNRRYFVDYFKTEFDSILNRQWDREAHRENRLVDHAIRSAYSNAIRSYARQKGYSDGYARAYLPASIETYTTAYETAASVSFQNSTKIYTGNAVVENVQISVRMNQDVAAKREPAPGDSMDVTFLPGAVNYGGQNFAQRVQITGNLVDSRTHGETLTIKAYSRLKDSVTLPAVANISKKAGIGSTATVQAVVGNVSASASVIVTLKGYLQKIGQESEAEVAPLVSHLTGLLEKEWDKESGLGSSDYMKPNKTLLAKVSAIFHSLPAQDQEGLRRFKKTLRGAYPKDKPWRLSPSRDEWEDVDKTLDKMGM